MKTLEERLIDLEMYVANQERILEDLNTEFIRLSKTVDLLITQNKMLMSLLKESPVKPLSEETRPPHY